MARACSCLPCSSSLRASCAHSSLLDAWTGAAATSPCASMPSSRSSGCCASDSTIVRLSMARVIAT